MIYDVIDVDVGKCMMFMRVAWDSIVYDGLYGKTVSDGLYGKCLRWPIWHD